MHVVRADAHEVVAKRGHERPRRHEQGDTREHAASPSAILLAAVARRGQAHTRCRRRRPRSTTLGRHHQPIGHISYSTSKHARIFASNSTTTTTSTTKPTTTAAAASAATTISSAITTSHDNQAKQHEFNKHIAVGMANNCRCCRRCRCRQVEHANNTVSNKHVSY